MTSLSEVYEGDVRTVVGRRRRVLATVLFLVGATLGTVAIVLTTTGVRSWFDLGVIEARRTGGLLAGVGLPAVLFGVFVAFPASRETRVAAVVGGCLTALGVVLFAQAYPDRWLASDPAVALATVAIYALGTLVTFWCLFVAVATFKRRNDPGGTARVELTDEGTVRLVSRPEETDETERGDTPAVPGLGGVGTFGEEPSGDVPTQTNADRAGSGSSSPGSSRTTGSTQRPHATSDGGRSVTDSPVGDPSVGRSPDTYCGNCAHLEYVRVDGEFEPRCGYHRTLMEDLEPCSEWTPNTSEE